MWHNKHRKIKNFIIYPKLQFPLIKLNLGLILLFLISIIAIHIINFAEMRNLAVAAGIAPTDHFFIFVGHAEKLFLINTLLVTFLVLLLGFAFTVLISHKIAGPLYRMQQYFRGKNQGENVGDLKFRDGDYLTEMADLINNKEKKG